MYIVYKKVKNIFMMHGYFKTSKCACKFISKLRDKDNYYVIYEECKNDNIFSFFKKEDYAENNFIEC